MPNHITPLKLEIANLARFHGFREGRLRIDSKSPGQLMFDPPDPYSCWWYKSARLEEEGSVTPFVISLYFAVKDDGFPRDMTMRVSPQLTAHSKSYIEIRGTNKVIVYFEQALNTLIANQSMYRLVKGRESSLKRRAQAILQVHANR